MKRNAASIPIFIIGAIVMLFSIIAFFITGSMYSLMNIIAFIFLLIAEIITIACFTWLTGIDTKQYSKILAWSGLSVVLSGYLIATAVLFVTASAWLLIFPFFLLAQIAILCGVAILLVCVIYFAKRVALRNEQDFYAQATNANNQPKRGGF